MRIGQLAEKTGIPVETIRYYEKEALISEPQRTENNYRKYTRKHLEELLFIKNCRAFDMTHEEIHQMIDAMKHPSDNCHAINVIIGEHLHHIDKRIAELKILKETLATLQSSCMSNHTIDECTIVEGLNTMTIDAPAKGSKSHLG